MNNQINSETKQENIMNQSRFLILTIASNCIKNNKQFNFKKLFKILVKNSKGALEKRAKKLLIQDKTFLLEQNYYVWICWQLSLDQEETVLLLE